jgi:hypothetical protein
MKNIIDTISSALSGKKIIGLALLGLIEAVSDGIVNNWTWRQYVVAGLAVATIVIRAYFTDISEVGK